MCRARPIHLSNSHTKFGWITSNGLGGDSVTDGQTDESDCNIPDVFFKKKTWYAIGCQKRLNIPG